MCKHDDLFPLSIGMKTNVSKKELIQFSRKDPPVPHSILAKNNEIEASDSMKILWVKFHKSLGWDLH